MKNLVVSVCGDTSFHKTWISGENPDFDLFVIYYGDIDKRYKNDGMYYEQAKGTKFLIVDEIVRRRPNVFDDYDAILIPDDDLYMESEDINRFFKIFHQYELEVAQPSIIGWLSVPIVTPTIDNILRFTNWVEIMSPCFSRNAFSKCRKTFNENRTNWGLDSLWYKVLEEPTDKFAIVDDVVVVHTRPCFYGDTYNINSNNFNDAWNEMTEVLNKYDLSMDKIVLGSIPRDMNEFYERPSEHKIFPNCPGFLRKIRETRQSRIMI